MKRLILLLVIFSIALAVPLAYYELFKGAENSGDDEDTGT